MTDSTSSGPGGSRELVVEEPMAGGRLDVFLATRLEASRAQVRALLGRGGVSVGGRRVSSGDKGQMLRAGERVEVRGFQPPTLQPILPDTTLAISVLARGTGWLAVAKPAGVAVHPLRPEETGTVLNALVVECPQIQGVGEGGLRSGVVHRLDVDTSGVLLVATDEAAWRRLRTAFSEHRIAKQYRALVQGDLRGEQRVCVQLSVTQHRPARVSVVEPGASRVRGGSRETELRVRAVRSLRDSTLVEIWPRTGFLHQIRATLAHLGHPVLGDSTYGAGAAAQLAARHMLHASKVAFEEIEVECTLPADFASLLDGLGD